MVEAFTLSVWLFFPRYQNRVAGEKDLCSSSDEEEEGAAATTTTDTQAEERIAFSGMSALKSQWETGTISNHRSDSRSVEDELTELRNKSKSSEPLKQLYERAIQEARSSENLSRPADTFVVDSAVRAGSIKEKFEKLSTGDESEEDRSERLKREREEEINRITESETCTKEARNRFKQIEANMGKDQVPNGSTGKRRMGCSSLILLHLGRSRQRGGRYSQSGHYEKNAKQIQSTRSWSSQWWWAEWNDAKITETNHTATWDTESLWKWADCG